MLWIPIPDEFVACCRKNYFLTTCIHLLAEGGLMHIQGHSRYSYGQARISLGGGRRRERNYTSNFIRDQMEVRQVSACFTQQKRLHSTTKQKLNQAKQGLLVNWLLNHVNFIEVQHHPHSTQRRHHLTTYFREESAFFSFLFFSFTQLNSKIGTCIIFRWLATELETGLDT